MDGDDDGDLQAFAEASFSTPRTLSVHSPDSAILRIWRAIKPTAAAEEANQLLFEL